MVTPGAFQGSRRESKKAMQAGVTADVLATIQRQYKFKRYLVDFAHDEELAAEVSAVVDDDLPDQEKESVGVPKSC